MSCCTREVIALEGRANIGSPPLHLTEAGRRRRKRFSLRRRLIRLFPKYATTPVAAVADLVDVLVALIAPFMDLVTPLVIAFS